MGPVLAVPIFIRFGLYRAIFPLHRPGRAAGHGPGHRVVWLVVPEHAVAAAVAMDRPAAGRRLRAAQRGRLTAADLPVAGGRQPCHGPVLARQPGAGAQRRARALPGLRRRQCRRADRGRPGHGRPVPAGGLCRRRRGQGGPLHQRPAGVQAGGRARRGGQPSRHGHPAGHPQRFARAAQPDHPAPAIAAGAHTHAARHGRSDQRPGDGAGHPRAGHRGLAGARAGAPRTGSCWRATWPGNACW